MTEKPYANREIDSKFHEVHKRFDAQDTILNEIKTQTTTTNGKVKRIIITLAVVLGFALGVAGVDLFPTLVKVFI